MTRHTAEDVTRRLKLEFTNPEGMHVHAVREKDAPKYTSPVYGIFHLVYRNSDLSVVLDHKVRMSQYYIFPIFCFSRRIRRVKSLVTFKV